MKKVFILLAAGFLLVSGVIKVSDASGEAIKIAYLQSDIHQLACWIALEKGFFKNEGLDVTVAGIFRAGPEEMNAFAAGALDIGYVGEAPATTAVANKTANVSVLAQVNTEGSAIVVRNDSAIINVLDLLDKMMAIPGHSTVQDFLFRRVVKKAGITNSTRVRSIVLKPPEMIGALRTEQINAFIAWEPYPAKAQTMGVGRVLSTSRKMWEAHPCCVLVADNEFLRTRPEEAKAIVRAHVKATDYINDHYEEAVEVGVKYSGMDQKTVQLAMKNVNYTYMLSIEGLREYVDFLSHLKYIRNTDSNALINRFINNEIIDEIANK